MASWNQSVRKAQAALRKTFEGRMAVAAASFEQIPPHGRGASHSRTLADFAEDVGVEYGTLGDYRAVYRWLGDSRPEAGISSWTLAKEAQRSGRWTDGAAFAEFLTTTTPPVWQEEGFEPHAFMTWTVDALRVHLGNRPTNTALAALRAAERGEDPEPDTVRAATASDQMQGVVAAVAEIQDRRIRAEAKHEVIHAALDLAQADGASASGELRPIELDIELYELSHHLVVAKDALVAQLEQVPSFIAAFGRRRVRGDTGIDLIFDTVQQVRGEVVQACDAVTGDFDRAASELLAAGTEE